MPVISTLLSRLESCYSYWSFLTGTLAFHRWKVKNISFLKWSMHALFLIVYEFDFALFRTRHVCTYIYDMGFSGLPEALFPTTLNHVEPLKHTHTSVSAKSAANLQLSQDIYLHPPSREQYTVIPFTDVVYTNKAYNDFQQLSFFSLSISKLHLRGEFVYYNMHTVCMHEIISASVMRLSPEGRGALKVNEIQ